MCTLILAGKHIGFGKCNISLGISYFFNSNRFVGHRQRNYHSWQVYIQYTSRNMHTVFALLCFVLVIHWLIFPYPSGLLHWHCGNLTIAPVPAKQPWWIWINTSCEFVMNDCITTTKQSTTKPCAYFLGYTIYEHRGSLALSVAEFTIWIVADRPCLNSIFCKSWL